MRPSGRERAKALQRFMEQAFSALLCIALGAAFLAATAFTWLRTRRSVEGATTAYGQPVLTHDHLRGHWRDALHSRKPDRRVRQGLEFHTAGTFCVHIVTAIYLTFRKLTQTTQTADDVKAE